MKAIARLACVCVTVLGATFMTAVPALAQTAVLPSFVVLDNNGIPVGPVIGISVGDWDSFPVIRLVDPVNDIPVPVRVLTRNALVAGNSHTYFSGSNCTGTAYHMAYAEQGLTDISGFDHSVARTGFPSSGNQQLYASVATDYGMTRSYVSEYVDSYCSPIGGSEYLRVATVVLDIDAAHPRPYTLQ